MSKTKIGDTEVELLDNSDKVKLFFDMAKKRGLEAIAQTAEANAVREITRKVYDMPESPTYKRTGRLRSSISHATDDDAAYIGTNVEYAPFVELGSSKGARDRSFLRPAATKPEYVAEYKRLLKESMENA